MAVSPFDYITAVSFTKDHSLIEENPEGYKPFLTNRALSYFVDSIFDAQEMNLRPGIPNEWAFDYFINSLPKRKRFSKWAKPIANEDVEAVMEYFGYSQDRAIQAISVLSKEQIAMIKEKNYKGGNNGKKQNRKSDG
jgi:hypothetical protein